MGHQIIKEPGKDTYAVFSSFSDQWIPLAGSRDAEEVRLRSKAGREESSGN